MRGMVKPNFLGRMHGTLSCLKCAILCHTLQAWQTRVYKKSGELKPNAVGGQPEPEPTSYSPGP